MNFTCVTSYLLAETLRKHPPAEAVTRICVKDYKVPGMDITLKTGDHIQVSIAGIHHDPEHYPDPEKFDPERFSEENKLKRSPFSFLAFGEGPRICIGKDFYIWPTYLFKMKFVIHIIIIEIKQLSLKIASASITFQSQIFIFL